MRFLILGAGAIGGYVGGSLALHGHAAAFLCRAATAAALRERGLRLTNPAGENILRPIVLETVAEALRMEPYDALLVAVKRYDTEAAIQPLLPIARELPPILCLQNGLDAEAELAGHFGEENVIPGTVLTAVARPAPNEIIVEKFRGMGVAAGHPATPEILRALEGAGLNPRLYPDAASMKWSKLLTNLTANPLSAILDMPPAEIFAHPGLFRVEMRQLCEALAVMRKLGARVVDLPGTPVRLLAFGARYLPAGIARPLMGRVLGRGRGGKMPSFHVDLHSGRGRSEVGFLHGAVADYGERVGVAAPVNRWLADTLAGLVDGAIPLGKYARRPDALLAELGM